MKTPTHIIVSLLVGVVLTFVIAWCATVAGGVFDPMRTEPSRLPADWELVPIEHMKDRVSEASGFGLERVWSAARCEADDAKRREGWVLRIRAGVPMHALECWETPLDAITESSYSGPLHRGRVGFTGEGEIFLPTRVRPAAFLVDTLCYGGLCYFILRRKQSSVPTCPRCVSRPAKRSLLRRAIWATALGTACTVASAWLLAVFPLGPLLPQSMLPIDEARRAGPPVEWTRAIFREHSRAAWTIAAPPGWPDKGVRDVTTPTSAIGRFGRRATDPAERTTFIEWSASGIPLCAMESRRIVSKTDRPSSVALESGIAVPLSGSVSYLPLRPMPVPFAINVFVASGALFLVFTTVSQVRRWRRERSARCPACGG